MRTSEDARAQTCVPLRRVQRRAASAKGRNIASLRGNLPRYLQHASKKAVLESDLMHKNSEHVQPNQY